MAADTGFRESELLRFLLADYQFNMLHIWESKNGKPRAVPATDRVKEIIQKATDKGHTRLFETVTLHDLRFAWKKIRKHMGLERDEQFVIHAFRHTCASRLVQRGVPLAVVQKWMGHKAIQTTLRYAHLAPDNFMDAMKVLNSPVSYSMQPQAQMGT